MAVIETAAQLNEHTSEGVKAAVMAAVETAARGAKAMGLSQVTVRGVRVLPEAVVVQVVATDDAAGSSPQEDPDDDTGRSLHDGQPNSQERL
ncbi:MAG TPA: hypothetical protein VMS64_09415 [Candidatus Methylomirabilis sp.]|nr:hypothetical protein [Candidatus Methylomirabilis sp.]